jgi:polar amino acid transport system substrate-binding protein
MKKFVFIIGLGFALSFSANSTELKFVTQDFAPFNYEINKVVSGPAADIIRKVCREIAINCTFNLLPWRRSQLWLKNGKANGMFVIGWNKQRAKWLHFSLPLITTQYGFFVHKDNPLSYQKPSDISAANIGVYGPSNTSNSLKILNQEIVKSNHKPINIQIKYDDIPLFKMLNNGNRNITAVYSNKDVGNKIIQQLKLKNIRYAGTQKSLNYYIGFSQQYTDKALVDKFNAALKKLHQTKQLQNILTRYQMTAAEID